MRLAWAAVLLFQATPPDGVPFEGAGTIISTILARGNRPPGADAERAFDAEGTHVQKWLQIPAGVNLQEGAYGWVKGVEKDGILRVTEAIVFPGESILRVFKSPRPEGIVAEFEGLGGGCDHIPGAVCRPSFGGTLRVSNQRKEAVEVRLERIFWSSQKDKLGVSTDKLRASVNTDAGPMPLPFELRPAQEQRISLSFPMTRDDCPVSATNVTVVLKIGGERVFLRGHGNYSISK